jgi:hypothetical protein
MEGLLDLWPGYIFHIVKSASAVDKWIQINATYGIELKFNKKLGTKRSECNIV